MVFADECWHKSLKPLMESVQEQMGDMPVYLTFDIDGIDPTACPGTGTHLIQNDYMHSIYVYIPRSTTLGRV